MHTYKTADGKFAVLYNSDLSGPVKIISQVKGWDGDPGWVDGDELRQFFLSWAAVHLPNTPTVQEASDDEVVAYEFKYRKPGTSMVLATVDPSGSEAWPLDQWKTVTRQGLVRTGQPEEVWSHPDDTPITPPTPANTLNIAVGLTNKGEIKAWLRTNTHMLDSLSLTDILFAWEEYRERMRQERTPVNEG